ncbi:MAG TPA: carboxypeptidase regulatory-like domain-containing protein [Acidobacteriaceae bacterium]|nr:carboxypeptidase regulatory-like domain-containing protein [Acidobacteriaceae bacterium]
MSLAKFRSVSSTLVFAFVLAFLAFPAHAVDVNARIKGTVTDPSGAVVPGATVTATNIATGVKYPTKSLSTGDYLFPQLPVGTYSITVSAPGFNSFTATGIVLNIDQEYVEPVKLQVGNTTETLEVAADAVQVNTTDMQLNNIVNSGQMEELPLIGRNFTALETTLPGVQPTDTRFSGTYSVSGAQAQQSEYLINGADTNDIALNTIVFVPNLDAIDQFNLIDGPLNAEYDRNSGGIVTATIKQGTNRFHGTGFEYYRDTFLNTNGFFQKQFSGGKRIDVISPYHQNIFGGTIGGPVFKDKLFFFGAYQGTHQRVPEGTYNNTVLTSNQLAGNFSSDVGNFSTNPIPSSISIPGCTTGETWADCLDSARGSAAAGYVPTSAFNALTTKLAKQYVPAANNGAFYTLNATENTTANQYIGRVDYNLNPKNQITVLGLYLSQNLLEGVPFSGATLPGFGDGSIEHIQQWTVDYVRQLSTTAVNDLSAHYTRFNYNTGKPQQVMLPSSAGFSITPNDTTNATLPNISVNGGSPGGFSIGGTTNGPQPRIDQVIQLDDNFTKSFGHHSLKFGYDGRKFSVWNLFDARNSGAYSFDTNGAYSTGDAFLDYLLGIPDTYAQGTGNLIAATAFLNYVFAQDSWKVTNTLTLNYGLGYSMDTPMMNHQYGGEAVACFIVGEKSNIFPGAPTNMAFPGDPGCYNSGQAVKHWGELGPRFGFAWAPDLGWISGQPGKFSVRGGFGIYYDRTEEESSLQTLGTPPFGFQSGGANDFGGTPSVVNPFVDINGGNDPTGAPLSQTSENNRFPYVAPSRGSSIAWSSLEPVFNISSYDQSFRAPYSENFQLSVERELPSRMVARLSYVGALGKHNQVTYEGDYETAAGHAACVADPSCVAQRNSQSGVYPSHTIGNNPNFIEIGEVGSYASSNYNSLQASITKAVTHGLQFQASYTYAHAMDDASSFENSGFGNSGQRAWNQFQKSLNYGDSTYDVRHHFVFSPVYTSPLIHGSAFSPMSLALSGWEISGILTLNTGEPYDISYAGTTGRSLWCSPNYSFYACPDVPVQSGPLVRTNPRNLSAKGQWFANNGFITDEPIGSFGNVHRNPYHGPGANNTNLVLAKNFILSNDGVMRLQLRMESDNVFNHTSFNNPSSLWEVGGANTAFGEITSAANARQTQLGARFYF